MGGCVSKGQVAPEPTPAAAPGSPQPKPPPPPPLVPLAFGSHAHDGNQPGKKEKEQQDASFAQYINADLDDFDSSSKATAPVAFACGVFDGHGSGGREAACAACTKVHSFLSHRPQALLDDPAAALAAAFAAADRSIGMSLDVDLCGTTATVLAVVGHRLYVAWCGDSRAVMGSGPALSAVALTRDHQGSDGAEAERVRRAGGRVRKRPGGAADAPLRVWAAEASGGPQAVGLMVTRSLGDRLMHEHAGVSSVPELAERELHPGFDRLLVVGSDGLFDLETNEDVLLNAWSPFSRGGRPEEAAEAAVGSALEKWRAQSGSDNVTAVVVRIAPDAAPLDRSPAAEAEAVRTDAGPSSRLDAAADEEEEEDAPVEDLDGLLNDILTSP